MSRSYLPASIAGLVQWAGVFTPGVAAGAAGLGVGPAVVAALQALHADMAAKVAAGTAAATRTSVSIAAMHVAVARYRALARRVSRIVHGQPGVTAGQLAALGLNVPRPRARIVAPTHPPAMTVRRRWAWNVDVQFSAGGPAVAGGSRPHGCVGLNVYVAVGQIPGDVQGWTNVGFFSRTRVTIPFDPALPPGTRVYIRANWQTRRGATSPACEPVEALIDGVGQQMTAGATMKVAA